MTDDNNNNDSLDVKGSPPPIMDDEDIDLAAETDACNETEDFSNVNRTSNIGDTTKGTESISTSVALVTPSVLRKTVKPIHPSSERFRCDNESATHEQDVPINSRGASDGKNTQGNADGLKLPFVYLNHSGTPPNINGNSLYGCSASNVDITPDRTNTRAKVTRTVNPDPFKDFPKNGVCLKHKGTRGISQMYRDCRTTLFRQMKCGRTKHGENFPNELLQTEIIKHLLTCLPFGKIRFFAMINGALIEYVTDNEIFDAIREDFRTNTDNFSGSSSIEGKNARKEKTSRKKTKKIPEKCLADLFKLNRIELNEGGIDQGKQKIYEGIMENINDAFARRMLDVNCEAELYDWCKMSFAYFFKNEIQPKDGNYGTRLSGLMKSKRALLKQRDGNQYTRTKIMIYEGILDDIGYAAVEERLSKETKHELYVWTEKTWKDFFENRKRKDPPKVIDDQNNDNDSSQSGPHDNSNRPEDSSKHFGGSSNNPSDRSPGSYLNSSNSSPSNAPTGNSDSMKCDQSNDSSDDEDDDDDDDDDDESTNDTISNSVCSDSCDDEDHDGDSVQDCEYPCKRRIVDKCTSIVPDAPVTQFETVKNTNSSQNVIVQRMNKMDIEDIHEVERTSIVTPRTISLHEESLTTHLSHYQHNALTSNHAEVQKKAKCLLMDLSGVTGCNATKTLNLSKSSSNLAKNQSSTKNEVFQSMKDASADVKTIDSNLDYDEGQRFWDATEKYLSLRNDEMSNETFIAIFDAMLNEVLLLKHRNELVDEGTRRCTYAFIDYGLKLCSTMDPDAVNNSMVDKVIVVEGGSLAETESMTLEPESFNGAKQTTTMSSSYISSIVHESKLVDHDVVFDRGTLSNQNVLTLSYMHYRDLLRENCKHQTSHGLKHYVSEKLMNFVENSGCRFLGEIPGKTGRYYVLSREQALRKIAHELRDTSSNEAKEQLRSNLNSVVDEDEKKMGKSRTIARHHHPSTFVSLEVEVKEEEQHFQKPRSAVSADDEFMNSFSGSISSLPPQTCNQKRRPPIMNDSRAVSIDCYNSSSNSFTMDEEGEQEEDVGYAILKPFFDANK